MFAEGKKKIVCKAIHGSIFVVYLLSHHVSNVDIGSFGVGDGDGSGGGD